MISRGFLCLAMIGFLSVLAPAPVQAQIEMVRFQGWIWNLTGGNIAVDRVTAQCWDPQQLAYQPIETNTFWSVITTSEDAPLCKSGFISANVLDKNNNILFWFELVDNFVDDKCHIYLFEGGINFYRTPTMDCGKDDTISYTIFVSEPVLSSKVVRGLRPKP